MGAFGTALVQQLNQNQERQLHHQQLALTGQLHQAQAEHLKQQTAQLKAFQDAMERFAKPTPGRPEVTTPIEASRAEMPDTFDIGQLDPTANVAPAPPQAAPSDISALYQKYGIAPPGPIAPLPQSVNPNASVGMAAPVDQSQPQTAPTRQLSPGQLPTSQTFTQPAVPPGPSLLQQMAKSLSPETQSFIGAAPPEMQMKLVEDIIRNQLDPKERFITVDGNVLEVGPHLPGGVKMIRPADKKMEKITNPLDQEIAGLSKGKYRTQSDILDAIQRGDEEAAKIEEKARANIRLEYGKQKAAAVGLESEKQRQEFRPGEIEKETQAHVKGQQEGQLKTFLGEKHDNWIDPNTLRPAKANQTFGDVYQKFTHIDDQQKPAMAQVRTLSNGLVRIEELGDKILRKRTGKTWQDAPSGVAQALNLSAKELAGDPDVEELQAIITQLTVPMAKLQGDTANVAVAERQMIGGSVFKKTDTIESLRAKTNNMLNVIESTLNGMGLNGTQYVRDTLSKQSMAKGRGVASSRQAPATPAPDEAQQYLEQRKAELRKKIQPNGPQP